MEAILAFGAALLTFRLAGLLAARWRARRQAYLLAWSAGLAAYALGAAAIAAGAAAGWNDGSFRAYYLFGGLLTAALLGSGSLLQAGVRSAAPVALVYVGLAIGVALAVPLESPIAGTSIPEAQEHLALFPARILAIVGNVAGSLALIVVSIRGFRRRPVGNALLLVLAGALLIALGAATQTEPHAATSSAARLAQLDAIADYRTETWRWQALMRKPRTPTYFAERRNKDAEYLRRLRELWRGRAVKAERAAQNPPHRRAWLCIHRFERHPEQGWATRTGNGYYGGLQMDISFQRTYGGELLRRKGTANRWTAAEQMWVAERAYKSGRGFYPWPNTARSCGLI